MLIWVEHEKSFITSGPDVHIVWMTQILVLSSMVDVPVFV